ncbi:MAG: hypothetical protein ABIF71_13355, partial [Planctomycetota bacterium]
IKFPLYLHAAALQAFLWGQSLFCFYNHGGRHVRVQGAVKVAAHLSFGLLVIAVEQLLTMLC